MRRSGQHPIIKWIAGHFAETTFINDYGQSGCCVERNLCEGEFGTTGTFHFTSDGDGECHITNYEDFLTNEAAAVAKGKLVVIIRDPYNCFASRIKAKFQLEHMADEYAENLWLDHAEAALNGAAYPILYNLWFVDETYRRKISEELCNRPYSEKYLNEVSPFGLWSSFDGDTYQGKAKKMDVLNRWRDCLQYPEFMRIVGNQKIEELAIRLFGQMV